MNLNGRGRRSDRWRFDHYLGDKATTLTLERKTEVIPLFRANQTDALRDELVLGHIKLGLTIVGHYLEALKSRALLEELVSAMTEAILDAVNRFPANCTHDNLTGYITDVIHSKLSYTIERSSVIRVPGATQRTYGHKPPKVEDIAGLRQGVAVRDDNLVTLEIKEQMDALCETDQERTILQLRYEGYTDQEIGAQLGLVRSTIWVIRQSIQKRFTKSNTESGQ